MQSQDTEKLKCRLAQIIASLTCNGRSKKKDIKRTIISPELKDILIRTDARIQKLYKALPVNVLFILSSGHGDTAIVQRCVLVFSILILFLY